MALLVEGEIAQQIGVSLPTIRRWRYERKGPAYIRMGRTIRYRQEDIDEFIARSVNEHVKPEEQAG